MPYDAIDWVLVSVKTLAAPALYLDATEHKIGKIPDQKGFLNMRAGEWAFAGYFVWGITVPLYLFYRRKLIEKAEACPVRVPSPNVRLFVILMLAVLVSWQHVSWDYRLEQRQVENNA